MLTLDGKSFEGFVNNLILKSPYLINDEKLEKEVSFSKMTIEEKTALYLKDSSKFARLKASKK